VTEIKPLKKQDYCVKIFHICFDDH